MFAWLLLFLAGVAEIIWAISMKQSDGFTRLWPTVVSIVSAGFSITMLSISLKSLNISIAYPIWVAIGICGVSIIGIVWLKEPFNLAKAVCVILIIMGSVGLKVLGE